MTDLFSHAQASADTRPVLCAMNNPISSDPEHALYPYPPNCAGWRLWRMLHEAVLRANPNSPDNRTSEAITKILYRRTFHRTNVLSAREWSDRDARASGRLLMDKLSGHTIVVLGVGTARALGLPRLPWLQWGEYYHLAEPTRYCIVPHPSGRCREYNDEAMRVAVGDRLYVLSQASP